MDFLRSLLRRIMSKVRRVGRRFAPEGARRAMALVRGQQEDADVTTARKLTELNQGEDPFAAAAFARFHLPTQGASLDFLQQARIAATRAGALTLQRDVLRRWRQLTPDDPRHPERAARINGRLRDTDPAWLPTVEAPGFSPIAGRVMHVLKISVPQRQSGYSVRSRYTLSGLASLGTDVVAVTALDFPQSIGVMDAGPEEQVHGVRHLRLLRGAVPGQEPEDAYLQAYAQALCSAVVAEQPSLLHVHSGHRGYDAAKVALSVGNACGIPVIYEVRGFFEGTWVSNPDIGERGETYARRRDSETACMRQAAAVVTLSESMKDDIVGRGIDPSHVHVVPNCVDTEAFAPQPRSASLRSDLGLDDRFVFGYISNIDHHREGHEALIAAALLLNQQGVRATALIVGDGKRKEQLEDLARASGATPFVVFTGKVPHSDIGAYYAQYDAFVVPRIDERAARLVTPLKPLEAMAAGVPLVMSDLPALRELAGGGERAALFAAADEHALTAVLAHIAANPSEAQGRAERAREWVCSDRQWRHNAERYQAIYAEVARELPQ